jgi:hypothetical protein
VTFINMWVCLTLHIVFSVGRRSSVLKVKTTPPAPEVASMKRARSASRPSAMKRKVLMDDSMVLHGEYAFFFSFYSCFHKLPVVNCYL